MHVAIPAEDLEFARRVDELGAEGLSQDEIATKVGLTKAQIRHRLQRSPLFCEWGAETRVRYAPAGKRLADLVETGQIVASVNGAGVPA